MLKVDNIYFRNVNIPLIIAEDCEESKNVYSVLVGKNGVGKSTILNKIAKERISESDYMLDNDNTNDNESKVIAISTSPFEKFPFFNTVRPTSSTYLHVTKSNYKYIGLKNGSSLNSATSLISSAVAGLIELIINKGTSERLLEVFNMLEFKNMFQFMFRTGFSHNRIDKQLDLEDNNDEPIPYYRYATNLEEDLHISFEKKNKHIIEELSIEEVDEIRHSLFTLFNSGFLKRNITIDIDFTDATIYNSHQNNLMGIEEEVLISIATLLKFELLKLSDLRVSKLNDEIMSLKNASSGEQCLAIIILGIAGHITDGSLILIDEPEISLHPSWQEDFIVLLMNVFKNYNNCHFIIATHSPQIISKLDKNNCFITSLTENKIYSAKEFYNKSSDYQLANLFNAPGFKNEYMMREVLTFLTNQSQGVNNKNIEKINELIKLIDSMEESDPVRELLLLAKESLRVNSYASM